MLLKKERKAPSVLSRMGNFNDTSSDWCLCCVTVMVAAKKLLKSCHAFGRGKWRCVM